MTDAALPALDVVTGGVLLGCGVVATWRRRGSWVGPLLLLVGGTWYVGNLVGPLLFLHRGPMVQLHVSYPTGRLHRRLVGVVAALAWAVAIYEGFSSSPWVTLGLALLVAATAADLYRRTSGRARKAGGPALLAALSFAGILALSAVNQLGSLGWDTPVALGYDVVVALIGLGLTVDLLLGRWTEATVADLVTQLAPDADATGLQAALRRALGDPGLVLGYWDADRDAYLDDAGSVLGPAPGPDQVTTPVSDDGRPSAVLVHSASVLDDPALLTAAAAAVRLSLGNARMRLDAQARVVRLAESRRRIVEAGDEQRQQLARDLAEGAERHLDAVAAQLALASETASREAREDLLRLRQEVNAAHLEVDRLVAGIRPLELEAGGLPQALPVLAGLFGRPVTVRVEVGRLPPAVEAALYFFCSEALTNVVRHAPTAVRVVVDVRGNDVVVASVRDDGPGGADVDAGTGLRGLVDRIEALGGSVHVESGPMGTEVVGRLSVADRSERGRSS